MPKKISDEDARNTPINVRMLPDLRSKLEAAAEETGRSLTQEAELRLKQSFDPVYEAMIKLTTGSSKSAMTIRAIAGVFDRISFEDSGTPNYINRAALSSAFSAILEEYFPPPAGLMADLFQAEDPKLKAKVEARFKMLAESILQAQRVALYGEQESSPGLSLLQSAQVLGLVSTEGSEAAKLFEAAAKAAVSKKKVNAE